MQQQQCCITLQQCCITLQQCCITLQRFAEVVSSELHNKAAHAAEDFATMKANLQSSNVAVRQDAIAWFTAHADLPRLTALLARSSDFMDASAIRSALTAAVSRLSATDEAEWLKANVPEALERAKAGIKHKLQALAEMLDFAS